MGTQVSGTLKYIYVDFNSPVKKGQLLAQIDPATFEASRDQARANLLSAKANLEKARTAMADAKRTFERNQELWKRNLIARSDLDTAETNYESAKAQVEVNRAQVAQADAALKAAETNLRYTRIVSPVSGTVVSRAVDVGQTVAASFQTPTLFNIAQDLTKMQIDTNVDEADIGRIVLGQAAEFNVDAYPTATFKGTVFQIRIAPQTVQNVVTYDVVVQVDNKDLKLKPGMTANVSIITAQRKGALRIPNAALRFSPAPRDAKAPRANSPVVWVLAGNEAKRVSITTGVTDGTYTEVTAGLQEGNPVIVEAIGKNQKAQAAPGGGLPRGFR